VSVSFHQPGRRFYDLQLDHWGFARLNGESFSEMHSRLLPVVERWWQGIPGSPPRNGFYDNSIRGVAALNRFAPNSSQHTFYFTMSFDATVPFPNESLTSEDLAAFPLKFPLNIVPDPFNFFSGIGAAGAGWISKVPGFPNNVSLAGWAVQVANNHLGPLGYFNKIPSPGPRIPRSDMLPFLSVFAYAMGGLETQMAPNITADELQHNDGIVNTASMRGPNGAEVSEVHRFPIRAFESVEMADLARGVYWHMGINKTMDHADEIGVFTVGQTVSMSRSTKVRGCEVAKCC
jgi:hypothetical protein